MTMMDKDEWLKLELPWIIDDSISWFDTPNYYQLEDDFWYMTQSWPEEQRAAFFLRRHFELDRRDNWRIATMEAMLAEGKTQKEIAAAVGIKVRKVSAFVRKQKQAQKDELIIQLRKEIEELKAEIAKLKGGSE